MSGAIIAASAQTQVSAIVVVGENIGWQSIDNGLTWTQFTSGIMYSVVYANHLKKFFAVGSNFIYSSSDGLNWSSVNLSPSVGFDHIVYSPLLGQMIVTGGIGYNNYFYSTDGITWNSGTLPNFGNYGMHWCNYQNGGTWAYSSNIYSNGKGRMYDSTDGVNWSGGVNYGTDAGEFVRCVADSPERDTYVLLTQYGRYKSVMDDPDGLTNSTSTIGLSAGAGFDTAVVQPDRVKKTLAYSPVVNRFVAIHANRAAYGLYSVNVSAGAVESSGTPLNCVIWSDEQQKFYAVSGTLSYSGVRLYESIDGTAWQPVYGPGNSYQPAYGVATS